MNTYTKYCPNVFVALCEEKHEKGEEITVKTKYGKDNECIVFNFLGEKEGKYLYSIVRSDGFNYQEYCRRKAERRANWAYASEIKSDAYYRASKEHSDFLSLAEPIKVGHHSENSHRAIIEKANMRTAKSVAYDKKAKAHAEKAEYWERKAGEVNLSMPESIDFFTYKLEKAKSYHAGLKDGTIEKRHSYSLTYAKKEVNELAKKVEIANKLWGENNE